MTGHGGWPMTVFLTPDGEPFFGGTYFPPDDRHGMPSFTPRAARAVATRSANAPRRRRARTARRCSPSYRDVDGARRAAPDELLDATMLDRDGVRAIARRSTRSTAASAARRSSRSRWRWSFCCAMARARGDRARARRSSTTTLDGMAARRHLRPARRRLRALLASTRVARAALREDALRQRAARAARRARCGRSRGDDRRTARGRARRSTGCCAR